MNGTTKIVVGVAVVAALGVGLFIAYKKKPEWFGISANPNGGNPAVGAPPTVDKTAQRIQAGTQAGKAVLDLFK